MLDSPKTENLCKIFRNREDVRTTESNQKNTEYY